MTAVLDSWAVMRLLEGAEPAATQVQEQIDSGEALISWINLGEIFYVVRRAAGEQAASETVTSLEMTVRAVLPDRDLVLAAGRIKSDFRMSYADSFAAATAVRHNAVLWTGDPELTVPDAPWRTFIPG